MNNTVNYDAKTNTGKLNWSGVFKFIFFRNQGEVMKVRNQVPLAHSLEMEMDENHCTLKVRVRNVFRKNITGCKFDAVNIQGHPSAETIDTVTTSDFWIPTQEFASVLAKILADPTHGFEQDVKPAPGGDSRFKKIWISYEPVRYRDLGRIGLFQSEKGARYGTYGDPSQMWSINLENFEKMFKDNPNLQ